MAKDGGSTPSFEKGAEYVPPEKKERKAPSYRVLLVLAFFTLNVVFNYFNKFLFSTKEKNGAGFQVPILATMSHASAGFLAAMVFTFVPSVYVRKPIEGAKMTMTIVGISIFFAGSIGLNNSSLQFLPLSMQQTIRSSGPAVVAVCSYFLEDKVFSYKQIASLVLLVGGVSLAVFGDQSGTEAIGVVLCFGSVLGSALQYVFVSITMNPENRLASFDVLLYTAVPTLVVMTPAMLLNDEPAKLGAFVDENGANLALAYFLAGMTLAVCYNLVVFAFIRAMNVTYVSVCGVFKVVLLITFSVIVLGDEIAAINALGLVLAMVAFALNSYFEFQRRMAKMNAADENNCSDNVVRCDQSRTIRRCP